MKRKNKRCKEKTPRIADIGITGDQEVGSVYLFALTMMRCGPAWSMWTGSGRDFKVKNCKDKIQKKEYKKLLLLSDSTT